MLKLCLGQIRANAWNCNFLGTAEQQALKQRMSEDGPEKTLPIVVRKMPDGDYEIVDGEHRWIIARELGWETIQAFEREADDLQSRALCIGYNRLRGRLNWIKLYEVVKKDLDTGIDLAKAYGEVLTEKELDWLLSLGNLIPKARLVLEDSLKRYSEYSLEQLYMLSLFPAIQQESLVERFKTPIVLHVLRQTLAPFLPEKIPSGSSPTKETSNYQQLYQETINTNQASNDMPEKLSSDKRTFLNQYPNTDSSFEPEEETNTQSILPPPLRQNIAEQNNRLVNTSHITPQTTALADPTTTGREQGFNREKTKAQTALLLVVSYHCDCGRHYNVNFKNGSVVVQKQNLLFEYIDFQPRTFQVYCDKCNSDHEFTVEGIEAETIQIFCRRCKPQPREGHLNINSGEVTWNDNYY